MTDDFTPQETRVRVAIDAWSHEFNTYANIDPLWGAIRLAMRAPPMALEAEAKLRGPNLSVTCTPEYLGMDGVRWAKYYSMVWPGGCDDEATMVGWFCNAIMAGYDEAQRQFEPKQPPLEAEARATPKAKPPLDIDALVEDGKRQFPKTLAILAASEAEDEIALAVEAEVLSRQRVKRSAGELLCEACECVWGNRDDKDQWERHAAAFLASYQEECGE